jgi:hypothetical protein
MVDHANNLMNEYKLNNPNIKFIMYPIKICGVIPTIDMYFCIDDINSNSNPNLYSSYFNELNDPRFGLPDNEREKLDKYLNEFYTFIDNKIKLFNLSDQPRIRIGTRKERGYKLNPYYVEPLPPYCGVPDGQGRYVVHANNVDLGNKLKKQKYYINKYSYYYENYIRIQTLHENTMIPIELNNIKETNQFQDQSIQTDNIQSIEIKDLKSKLDEQLKLNETLCKRLFELK